ncbi:MAG: class I SAM-dependent methyltransferase [Candidatus Thorarchaeota archaeon]
MDNELSEKEEILLGLMYSISLFPYDENTGEYILSENRRVRLDNEGLLSVAKNRFEDTILEAMLKSLQNKKMILVKDKSHALTDLGIILGKKIRAKNMSSLYDKLLLRCAQSNAYAEFCEKVYGKNLMQFNVVDFQQIDLMLERLAIKSTDVVLDLGCGLGKITEYLAERTGAQFTGIDFSQKSIEWANANSNVNEKLHFSVMDINELSFPKNSMDVIIALDVLYWLDDLTPVIKNLKDILKKDGRMGIFYVQFANQNTPDESLNPENTQLAKLLSQFNLHYEIVDVSHIAIDLWKRKLTIGKQLRSKFLEENNQDIIDERLTDGENVLKKFELKQQKRYFFYVTK